METQYGLSPSLTCDRSDAGELTLHAGDGSRRRSVSVGDAHASDLLEAVLTLPFGEKGELSRHLSTALGCSHTSAGDLVDTLVLDGMLVPTETVDREARAIAEWSKYNWGDPVRFHLATFGQPFEPDSTGRAGYDHIYAAMLADEDVIDQPEADYTREGAGHDVSADLAAVPSGSPRMQDVLEGIRPVYAFLDGEVSVAQAYSVVGPVFRRQRSIKTGLGPAQLRSYPSGGARHPIEAYLVVKRSTDASPGVYHASSDGTLRQVNDSASAARIDEACFKKRGVQSADIAVVLTARWVRHMWKYRYPRSYRMLLMEVGHAIQELNLAASAAGLNLYYCPSMNDALVSEICAIEDPLEEGPVIVLALGKSILTAEEYHERFDVEPR